MSVLPWRLALCLALRTLYWSSEKNTRPHRLKVNSSSFKKKSSILVARLNNNLLHLAEQRLYFKSYPLCAVSLQVCLCYCRSMPSCNTWKTDWPGRSSRLCFSWESLWLLEWFSSPSSTWHTQVGSHCLLVGWATEHLSFSSQEKWAIQPYLTYVKLILNRCWNIHIHKIKLQGGAFTVRDNHW